MKPKAAKKKRDRRAYQRELMRRKRAREKELKLANAANLPTRSLDGK